MNKKTFEWHGRKYYLVGVDKYGDPVYLEEARWDCNWYWGLGYLETFTNKKNPKLSRDISSHTHFDTEVLNARRTGKGMFEDFMDKFPETPLNRQEIWQLLELMSAAYSCRRYSDMLYTGGAHITENPVKMIIQNEEEYDRINKKVIPAIMDKVYTLLS